MLYFYDRIAWDWNGLPWRFGWYGPQLEMGPLIVCFCPNHRKRRG